jgi:hypothetical protein
MLDVTVVTYAIDLLHPYTLEARFRPSESRKIFFPEESSVRSSNEVQWGMLGVTVVTYAIDLLHPYTL